MFELHLFIPLTDNDGRTFTEAHYAQFEREVLEPFGGLSRMPGHIAGQWVDQDVIYYDTLRAYTVASIVDGAKIGELVEIAKPHYRQEAIHIRYLGQAEIL